MRRRKPRRPRRPPPGVTLEQVFLLGQDRKHYRCRHGELAACDASFWRHSGFRFTQLKSAEESTCTRQL